MSGLAGAAMRDGAAFFLAVFAAGFLSVLLTLFLTLLARAGREGFLFFFDLAMVIFDQRFREGRNANECPINQQAGSMDVRPRDC